MCALDPTPAVFLWDDDVHARPEGEGPMLGGPWWEQYVGAVSKAGTLSARAIEELTRSTEGVLSFLPNPKGWEHPALFKGVVVGAVQSGKTQSMMAVSAAAIDYGYKLIVVLAGVRDDLRTQTARRFNTTLLRQSDPVPGRRGATTLGGTAGLKGSARGFAPPFHVDCHNFAPLLPKLQAGLRRGMPSVVVIKKHPASLNDLASVLREVYDTVGADAVPTLILDDECDEATVPGSDDELAVPTGILSLWNTAQSHPRVAYIGYTATAAANLLQHPTWALYPHWVYLLRYASAYDSPWQFQEPSSDSWYTGAECYFEDFGDTPGEAENFLIAETVEPRHLKGEIADNESLRDSLRAYFVSGAYRLALDRTRSFDDANRYPLPHTMLIHTSVVQDDHARWASGLHRLYGRVAKPDGTDSFEPAILEASLASDETPWRAWYERFSSSRERIYNERAHEAPYDFVSWADVRQLIPLVVAQTRLKVINSDDGASSLDFSQPLAIDGSRLPPQDCYVVAIGGSRFSRGLTIEGLCVTYFARHATMRYDDVVLQMNRWFGHRGRYIEFCRVFTTEKGSKALADVAANDLALRGQLAVLMQERRAPADATIVFNASPYSRPTAKLGAGIVHDLTFSPFTRVLPYAEVGGLEAANATWAHGLQQEILARAAVTVTRSNGLLRGVLSRGWTALEVAQQLERWSFSLHNPEPVTGLLAEHYRQPDRNRVVRRLLSQANDPYQIAAYLRMWNSRGDAPRFNVGFAYGELADDTAPFDVPLLNRAIDEDGYAPGGWTGRSENWRGDVFFDNPSQNTIQLPNFRTQGSEGLFLLYVIHKNAIGHSGRGQQRSHHTPFIGLAIPAGGPTQVHVLSRSEN